jgi:hypothetical protein
VLHLTAHETMKITYQIGVSWFWVLLFWFLGIMNAWKIHIIPGLFYLTLSLLYLPLFDSLSVRYLQIKIPFWIKMVVALLILWATLAVGDLAELYGL